MYVLRLITITREQQTKTRMQALQTVNYVRLVSASPVNET